MTRSLLVALVVSGTLLGASSHALGDPYEIPAHWVESEGMLSPIGVDFTFTRIDSVQGLGVVAYGDRLLLRVADDDNPFVTLGIAGQRFADDPTRYTSVAAGPGAVRLMSISYVVGDATAFDRETVLERVDLDTGHVMEASFPPPAAPASAWSSIALFTARKGNVLALAARTPPVTRPGFDAPPTPALEQRVFSLQRERWVPGASLEPAELTVSDACVAGDALIAVGTMLAHDANGALLERRGSAAVLVGSAWVKQVPAAPANVAAWGLDRVACGGTRDNVVAVGTTAADTQSISRRALLGPSVLYTFDGSRWNELEGDPGAPRGGSLDFTRVSAIGVAPDRSLWVAYERPDDPARELYRYSGGRWHSYAVPPVPLVSSYVIRGISFDGRGNGWAIANLEGAADHPDSHGILLHFDGKMWEERPWTWSPLKQRWFGLFGSLS